ncbi:histone deacetylase complex subunit SAP25 isoform X2 [Choloepus didactylus]|uniref:histone deacetylase complex subunit SAP25 isoform X2 n=1 Tax=Choloepus didactylus TaxID=27675 RepID=UPI0018A11A65|nr:histone deacetylase complex subunit SAP25 isoform X2 [Choloepus didactylus]
MLPSALPRWGSGEEETLEGRGPSSGSDQGEAWSSGEEAPGEPRSPPQDRHPWVLPLGSRKYSDLEAGRRMREPVTGAAQSLSPSWSSREQLRPGGPPGQAAEWSPGSPVPLSPQVAPSGTTLLLPWDPNYETEAGPGLVWGFSCGSGASFSTRTLCHPSFWLLYEAASGRALRPLAPTRRHDGEQVPGDAGFPVMGCEDVFFSDPLLPRGHRVPLYLSEAPQQVMGSLRLLPPPPVMSPWVLPTPSPGCSTTWLSGPELIALTGLLHMSQGEPRPSSPAAPSPPAGSSTPGFGHPHPSGGPSSSHCPDPSLPQTPETHSP